MKSSLSLKVVVTLFLSYAHSTNLFAMEHIEDKKPLLIFHAAYEAPNAKVGGLGAVVTDLLEKQNSFNVGNCKAMNVYILTPFYQFLKESLKDKVKHVRTFIHYVFGLPIETKVYKHPTLNQFLLEPDSSMANVLDIVDTTKNIYQKTLEYDRLVYWNSAVAAFTNFYKEDENSVDILHCHDWHSGLAIPLLSKVYNLNRQNYGLNEIKTVATTHFLEVRTYPAIICENVGFKREENSKISIAEMMNYHCNLSSTVSHGYSQEMLKSRTDCSLDKILKHKMDKDAFRPILNGIDHRNYDPAQKNILDIFAVHPNYYNLSQKKREVKDALYNYGIIGDKNRSLMLFVGRYATPKGTDYLPTLADAWIKLGGQVVIMGAFTEDSTAKNTIEKMKYSNKSKYLKVYTDYQFDQNTSLSDDVDAKKGNLLRFASDWTAVPSRTEPCGLVQMEALSFGSAVFTSWVEGLGDTCKPLDVTDYRSNVKFDKKQFNSIAYCYSPDNMGSTQFEIQKNLKKAYDLQHENSENWRQYQMRWCEEAKGFDWSSPNGPLQQYYDMYQHVIKNL